MKTYVCSKKKLKLALKEELMLRRVHVRGEMTIYLVVLLFSTPAVFCCLLTLTTFLSPLPSHTLSLPVKLVFTLLMFSLCSNYGLKPLLPLSSHPPGLPPSLALFLCSSSWRLQLCSSFLLAFLVRYRCRLFYSLWISLLLNVRFSGFWNVNCLICFFTSLSNHVIHWCAYHLVLHCMFE